VEWREVLKIGAVLGELAEVHAHAAGVVAAAVDHAPVGDPLDLGDDVGRRRPRGAAVRRVPREDVPVQLPHRPGPRLETGGDLGGVRDRAHPPARAERPAVERAGQAAVLDHAVRQVGAQVRAVRVEHADRTVGVAPVEHEALAQRGDGQRPAAGHVLGLGQAVPAVGVRVRVRRLAIPLTGQGRDRRGKRCAGVAGDLHRRGVSRDTDTCQ